MRNMYGIEEDVWRFKNTDEIDVHGHSASLTGTDIHRTVSSGFTRRYFIRPFQGRHRRLKGASEAAICDKGFATMFKLFMEASRDFVFTYCAWLVYCANHMFCGGPSYPPIRRRDLSGFKVQPTHNLLKSSV